MPEINTCYFLLEPTTLIVSPSCGFNKGEDVWKSIYRQAKLEWGLISKNNLSLNKDLRLTRTPTHTSHVPVNSNSCIFVFHVIGVFNKQVVQKPKLDKELLWMHEI